MAKQAHIPFLEEWLRSNSGGSSNIISKGSSSSSARAIIQAWSDLRDSLQHQSFSPRHHQSLKILLNSQASLYVADPQAKLLLSILSSTNISLPPETYPLFLRLLYIWIRKSSKPSPVLVDSAVKILSDLLSTQFDFSKNSFFFSEIVVLLGAFSLASSVSEKSKTLCLELLCGLLEEEYRLIGSSEQHVPNVLAGSSSSQITEHAWWKDEVQTSRILFYLRVIPTCIECLPVPVFRNVVAPIMFLYIGHPNGKVARASHSVFVAFISSGKDSDEDERVLLKEQLVFYYIQRSLEGYPQITPFEGIVSGVAALVRHLPAGSPSIFYTIHSLVEKAHDLCCEVMTQENDLWQNWQGELEPCKKILDLLLRLLSIVDIQVLPSLMKQLAQLVAIFPREGQNMVLNELYAQVADSDDVTRKPALVSWLQSLSYICSQANSTSTTSKRVERGEKSAFTRSDDTLSLDKINARL